MPSVESVDVQPRLSHLSLLYIYKSQQQEQYQLKEDHTQSQVAWTQAHKQALHVEESLRKIHVENYLSRHSVRLFFVESQLHDAQMPPWLEPDFAAELILGRHVVLHMIYIHPKLWRSPSHVFPRSWYKL